MLHDMMMIKIEEEGHTSSMEQQQANGDGDMTKLEKKKKELIQLVEYKQKIIAHRILMEWHKSNWSKRYIILGRQVNKYLIVEDALQLSIQIGGFGPLLWLCCVVLIIVYKYTSMCTLAVVYW